MLVLKIYFLLEYHLDILVFLEHIVFLDKVSTDSKILSCHYFENFIEKQILSYYLGRRRPSVWTGSRSCCPDPSSPCWTRRERRGRSGWTERSSWSPARSRRRREGRSRWTGRWRWWPAGARTTRSMRSKSCLFWINRINEKYNL